MPDVTRNLIGPLPRFARAFLIRMTVCILLLAAAPAAGNAQPGPPQIVSHFVDHTAVTSHFFENMYRALQLPDGRIVALSVVGRLAGEVPQFNTASLFFRRIRIGGVAVGAYTNQESHHAWRASLELLNKTGARPLIDHVFRFEELPAAFDRLARGPMGKVLIKTGANAG